MTEKQQIEEMQRTLKMAMCQELPFIEVCELGANELYQQGYRKIPQDAVVLTREEHDKLCHLAYFGYDDVYNKAQNEMACAIVRAVFDVIDWRKDTKTFENYIVKLAEEYSMLIDKEEQASKETAREIFVEVLDLEQLKVIRDMGWEIVYNTLYNEILELAKQYGVEVE